MRSGSQFWRWQGLWLIASLCASVAAAQAPIAKQPLPQPAVEAEAGVSLRHAQEHFLLGLEFYRTSGYREALREFEAALALAPSADIWFNIGRAHQQLGQYAQAIQALERYLRDRVDAPDAAAVRTQIRKLSERASALGERSAEARSFGSVRVYHATADAQVFVDGRPLAGAALAAPLLLPSGRHRFDVLERGRVPLHALLEVQPGLLTAAYADLPTTHVAHTLRASHGVDFALLGVAGAGAIVSATFGILSATQQADGRIDSAHAWARRADVALAGTALCALVAGVVYLALERGARTELLPAANDAR